MFVWANFSLYLNYLCIYVLCFYSASRSRDMEIPILSFILSRLKILIFHLIGYIKRALCCFGRRRRDSGDSIPLTGVGVIPSAQITVSSYILEELPFTLLKHFLKNFSPFQESAGGRWLGPMGHIK